MVTGGASSSLGRKLFAVGRIASAATLATAAIIAAARNALLRPSAIAGIAAAVDYIAELGRHCDSTVKIRRGALQAAYHATHQYETGLLTRLIEGLQTIPGMRIFGITDAKRFGERCSTLSFRMGNHNPTAIATFLGDRGIFTWDGNFYALNLSERLGVEQHGGVLRVGLVHYNTMEEVARLLAALGEFAA